MTDSRQGDSTGDCLADFTAKHGATGWIVSLQRSRGRTELTVDGHTIAIVEDSGGYRNQQVY